jgi:hypothetical protein
MGQRQYGRLNLANDPRNWRKERADELADALVYGAIMEVAAETKRTLAPEPAPSHQTRKSDNPLPRGTST